MLNTQERVLDAAGRPRSPATLLGHHAGRPPRNKGLRYPADPPRVEEIVAVMRQAGNGVHGARIRGLIVVLWRAGLRISEALDLAEAALDPDRGALLVRRGKGGKRQEAGMDDWGWDQLRPWLEHRGLMPVGPLFCVVNGPTRGRPWSGSAAREQLRRLAVAAGVRRRFAPHQLRHAHAVEMAREGVPLNVIQRQLGHADLGVISVYLQGIDNTEVISTISRAPRADDACERGTSYVTQGGGRSSRTAKAPSECHGSQANGCCAGHTSSDMGSPGGSLTVAAVILVVFGFAASAQGAFPGTNGRIGYALETYPTLSDAESSYELVTILPDGTARRAVGGAASGPVAFSPDGRRIIYVDGYDLDIRIASVNERGRSRVLTKSFRDGYEESGWPEWSPSGRRIVYQRRHADGPTELWINFFRGERRLTEGTDPAWSVRGDIAFTPSTPSGDAGRGIRVIRPDGTRERQISPRGRSPDWSPDGRRIVFTVGSRIASMRVDGSGFQWLATGSEPSFSPDGKQIAFLRGSAVWKMTSAGRRVKRLRSHFRFEFEDFGTTVYAPDWQPRLARGAQLVTGS